MVGKFLSGKNSVSGLFAGLLHAAYAFAGKKQSFNFFSSGRSRFRLLLALTMLMFSLPQLVVAQTSGLIYQPSSSASGRAVLDPNGDGYISTNNRGFTESDIQESEIPYVPIPQLEFEPKADLKTGPNCGFTDFVDDGTEYAAGVYFRDNPGTANDFLLFRFRLAGTANNSKGYSILIDTDQRMGAYGANADPNYLSGNPGFEIEVVLRTNFAVDVYNVDGIVPGANATPVASFPYLEYCQKAIAKNIYNGGCDNKYFYDFYVPFSSLTSINSTFPQVTSSTPLRMVANTVIAPKSVLQGPISDIQGIDDRKYANADLAWSAAIANVYPVSVSNINAGFGADRSLNIPVLNGPISPGATSASVTVGTAGIIKIYKSGNATPVCSTTVNAGGTYNLSGCTAFSGGDNVYATLTETGKSESENSNVIFVRSCTGTISATLAVPLQQKNNKELTGTCASGAVVRLYRNGVFYANATVTNTTWVYAFPGTGNNLVLCGTWQVTQTVGTNCESALSDPYCQSANAGNCTVTITQTSTPTITGPLYNANTSVSGTVATAGDSVFFFHNNVLTRAFATTSTSWSVSGLTLAVNDVILVRAKTPGSTYCRSLSASATVVTTVSKAPVVNGGIIAGATVISGSSVEPDGTIIRIYINNVLQATTVTVQSDGSWTFTTSAVASGTTIYATATATGKTVSGNSNTVTVQPAAETVIPGLTGAYNAGATSVSGQLTNAIPSTQYTIILYEDDFAIDTFTATTNASGTVNFTSNVLGSLVTSHDYLFSGGVLNARAFRSGASTAGPLSNSIIVGCSQPDVKTWGNAKAVLDEPGAVTVTVSASQTGVVYSLTNSDGTQLLGNSMAGNNGNITLTSDTLTSSTDLYVKAEKIGETCKIMLTGSKEVIVDVEAIYNTQSVTFEEGYQFSNNETVFTVNDADGFNTSGTNAQITSGSLPAGFRLNAANGRIYINNASAVVAGSESFVVRTTDRNGNTTSHSLAITVNNPGAPLPVDFISFNGFLANGIIELKWVTAWEVNNDYFTIERSADGINFNEIGRQKGAGNSSRLNNYSYNDLAPLKGLSYYRIKQTDFNGELDFSKTITIRNYTAENNKPAFVIYPNPVVNGIINVQSDGYEDDICNIYLYNMLGQLVFQQSEVISRNTSLNLKNKDGVLNAGIYTIQIQTGNNLYSEKIMVK